MVQKRHRDLYFHIVAKHDGSRVWRHEGMLKQREAVQEELDRPSLKGCVVRVIQSRESAEDVLARVQSGEMR